jgi:hypothetical protein
VGAVSLIAWSTMSLRRFAHFAAIFSVLAAAFVLTLQPHQVRVESASYPQVRSTGVDNLQLLHRVQRRQVRQAASRSAHRVALHRKKVERLRRVQAQAAEAQQNVQPSVSRETTSGVPAIWAAMATCEAGGNWASNTGNGFYGGLQFTMGTWSSYGGTGIPQAASPSVQIMVARRILTTGYGKNPPQGVNAWPVCGPRVGLQPGD